MQQSLFPECDPITINKIYELDGAWYRLLELKECGLGLFQEVDKEGKPVITYHKNSEGENLSTVFDWGRRIIWNRIGEIREVNVSK